jgi:single-stranded-DNA-specific exonuclease
MTDVWQIKGAREFVDRILRACKNKEKIILFGDADTDGAASVIILKEVLEVLGNPPFFIYFPNRAKDGYGLNQTALRFLKDKAPALLIVLDCGIGNIRGVKLANRLGFEVIIVDHHEVLDGLPEASIIINPKQEKERDVFKELCTAGIVYNLAKSILFEAQMAFEPENFLELAVIATLADQMPHAGENEKILNDGLLCLKYTKRQGLKALIEISGIKDFSSGSIRKKLIPLLSSASLKNHKNEAYLLLTEQSIKKSEKIAKFLFKKSKLRKRRIRDIFEQAQARVDLISPVVFLGDENWPYPLVAVVASKLFCEYKKPTFVFKKGRDFSQGSVRTPKEINSVKMMAECASLLKTYGGHARASGFKIKNENLKKFEKCLIKALKEQNFSHS